MEQIAHNYCQSSTHFETKRSKVMHTRRKSPLEDPRFVQHQQQIILNISKLKNQQYIVQDKVKVCGCGTKSLWDRIFVGQSSGPQQGCC